MFFDHGLALVCPTLMISRTKSMNLFLTFKFGPSRNNFVGIFKATFYIEEYEGFIMIDFTSVIRLWF